MSNAHERYLASLPIDWGQKVVSDLGSIVSGGTPSREVSSYWNGDIPWVAPSEMTELRDKYLFTTRERITESGLKSSSAVLLPKDALLITTRATVGHVALAGQCVATNQGFKSIVFDAGANPNFYYHLFKRIVPELLRRSSGTTFLEIPRREFASVTLPAPPEHEQCRIAGILDTLDESIRQTERVIEKLRRMKQGLLHDLLTRGLDDNGELRDPERHPEQFKDSPLGRIPKEWQVSPLGNVAVGAPRYGAGAPALPFDPNQPRYVRITDITDTGVLAPDTRASIRHADAEGYFLYDGDLVFARSGATVGKTYLYNPDDGPCAHAGYVIKFTIDRTVAVPAFVSHWTQGPYYWQWVGRTLRQGAQPNLNASEYARHLMPLPPLNEQCAIVRCLDEQWTRDLKEQKVFAKLRTLKQGLMDDVLTGCVRVSVSEEAVA